MPGVCPPIKENIPAKKAAGGEINYLFSFTLQVSNQDVKEYIKKYKDEKEKSKEGETVDKT